MKKLPLIALPLFFVAACSQPRTSGNHHEADFMEDEVEVEYKDSEGDEDAVASGKPWAKDVGRYDEVFNDSNYIQYEAAERLGIDPIISLYEAYNTRRPLVKIESGETYQLDRLTHSMPYLVPEAARLLDEIGADFGNLLRERGGDPRYNKIIVTSLLRSPYTVRKLRRVNKNAVDSSTHMFGTTFDIAWNNFHYPDSSKAVNAGVLKGILAEVLAAKQAKGECLVKYEKKTPCFHITVSKIGPANE